MKHRSLLKKRILLLLTLSCLAIASLQNGSATIIVVTNTNDSGLGSLRDALRIANNDDTISFAVTGTITLTSDQLVISKSLTITGPGAGLLAINGNGNHRVFLIRNEPGEHLAAKISGLTITNGSSDIGGGIRNSSELTLSNCIITSNSAREGGGIYNVDATGEAATLTVSSSTITGNSCGSSGGGIYNYNAAPELGATINLNDSTISGNSAHDGGGVYNIARHRLNGRGIATTTISNSTISGNTARGNVGGGIYTEGNSGGGLFFGLARLTINNNTISGNSARLLGGAIYITGTTVSIGQTILKRGASGQNIYRQSGTVTSVGYNLSDDNGGGFLNGPGDQINTDPLLGPLQNNGGPTLTHALLPGSPAIDRGNPSFTPPPDYDQRDCPFVRVFNGRIDVGSVESQPQPQSRPCSSPRPRPTPPPRRSQ